MNATYNLSAYAIYMPVVLTLTIVVSELLFKNAKIFMMDIFHRKEEIAMADNVDASVDEVSSPVQQDLAIKEAPRPPAET